MQILETIEAPYDEYEKGLLVQIEELKIQYQQAIKPYVDALVRSRACKPSRYIIREVSNGSH